MPFFVSEAELDKLRRSARLGEDVKKLEKNYRKQINQERAEHAEAIEDLTDAKDREIHTLQRKVDKADVNLESQLEDVHSEYKNQIDDLNRDHESEVARLNDSIKQLNGKIGVLEGRVATEADLTRRELDISDAEDESERVAGFLLKREKDFEKKVKEFDARVKDENEAQYKSGYTDGVSDTLREAKTLAETGNERTFKLAEKALDRETTVIATTTAPQKSK